MIDVKFECGFEKKMFQYPKLQTNHSKTRKTSKKPKLNSPKPVPDIIQTSVVSFAFMYQYSWIPPENTADAISWLVTTAGKFLFFSPKYFFRSLLMIFGSSSEWVLADFRSAQCKGTIGFSIVKYLDFSYFPKTSKCKILIP